MSTIEQRAIAALRKLTPTLGEVDLEPEELAAIEEAREVLAIIDGKPCTACQGGPIPGMLPNCERCDCCQRYYSDHHSRLALIDSHRELLNTVCYLIVAVRDVEKESVRSMTGSMNNLVAAREAAEYTIKPLKG
jgi:hypothetical protein